ncbi:TonB-dependent receptor [Dyella amyloliquefaciens]|uniref:TonB-dependent receptor n=1 Tax=Dyella amyloliquefaciens TaxID=1770545 RepID=UPI00102EC1B6|nr:TonB-dependent receptor [Dyella amyloliquefaciens]
MKLPHHLKKTLLASLIASTVVATVAVPTVAWSQTANATLRGKGPANTEVTAKNVASGAVRRTTTEADGSYALVGLQPGTYQVDAGPGTERTVTLTVASTASLDLTAAAPATTANAANAQNLGSVSVSATTLQEVKTPEVGATISLRQIDTIPQVSRNFLEFADTVPGMVFSVDPSGHTSLRGGAMNDSSVNVYIDGVGQKSYVVAGGVSGQSNSQGNPFPQLAIGEYKVITSNYKAEFDQLASAAVTAQTKSGTNEFHGETYYRYTDDSFRAMTPAESAAGTKASSQEKEYGFAVGGPIIKDQMHFFMAYEAKRFDTPVTVAPSADGAAGVPYLPSSVAAQMGPANLPFQEDLYFGKIDWEPTDRDRFEASAQIRNETQLDGIGADQQNAVSAARNVKNDAKRYVARWQHSGQSYFNELIFAYEDAKYSPTAVTIGNGYVYTWQRPIDDPTIIATGAASPQSTQNKSQKGPSIQDDFTFNDLEWHGDHVVKMGVKLKAVTLDASDASDINPQYYYNVTADGTAATPYKAYFTKPVNGLGLTPSVSTKSRQFGTYIQDDWAVNDKLTLNLGVRWDYERTPSYTDFVTPANVVAAIYSQDTNAGAPAGQTYAETLAKGGININDYISNGHNRSAYKGEWQPRLGFSYDWFGDEQHVIHGGAGRSYDRDLYDYLQLETTKSALPQYTIFFQDPATGTCHRESTPCYKWDPNLLSGLPALQSLLGASSNAGTEVDLLNNNLKAPYSDQFSLGMSNQLGEWQTDATVVRALSYNGFAFTLGNRYPNGAFFQHSNDNQQNSQPWGNGIPGFGALILGDNGIATRSTQVLLSASKPYDKASGWGATFAYTFTHAKQNRDINEHYSFDYGTIQEYPFITSNAAAKHRFVATGNMDGPWGTVLSAKLTLATPLPYNGAACYPGVTLPDGSSCVPSAAVPQGSKFLVGGKIWGYRDIDLQATKDFDLGHGMTLYGRFDVLNVFNWHNYSDYIATFVPGNTMVSYNQTGNITFVPRTVKLEVGLKF